MSVAPVGRQLSLFGVEAAAPTPLDIEGLLAGPGKLTRMGGTARVSVLVSERWRVAGLLSALTVRGLAASWTPNGNEGQHDGRYEVRTAYSSVLARLGTSWLRESAKTVPHRLTLDGQRLRWWVVAAGFPDGRRGYLLRLGPEDGEPVWRAIGSALASVGLPSVLLGMEDGGPSYRVVGRRRLARLAELVGEPPDQAPPEVWPR